MNNKIKVSVIIPVYNVEKYIERCINSIVNQTLKEIEIIIINDGTKDKSIEKIKCFLKDSRIILVNQKNRGLSATRNRGINLSKGEYIFHVDSDDFIQEDTLEKMYNKAIKYNLDIVVCDILVFYKKNDIRNKIWKDCILQENEIIYGNKCIKKFFLGECRPSVWNKLWRKELYIKNMIYHPPKVSYGEDGATVPKLILNSLRIGKINRAFYNYQQRNNSMMNYNINLYSYFLVYKSIIKYLKNIEKLNEYKKYLDSYKYNYVYGNLNKYIYINKIIRKNSLNKLIYLKYLKDYKNMKIISLSKKQKFLKYMYSKNIYVGEILKECYILFLKIKEK